MAASRWIVAGEDGAAVRTLAAALDDIGPVVACAGPLDAEDRVASAFDDATRDAGQTAGLIALIAAADVGPIGGLEARGWEDAVSRPLRQAFLLAQRAVDEFMTGGGSGRIVFVLGWPDGMSHDTEVLESALNSLSRSIAKEYGRRGITCNVVVAVAPRASAAGPQIAAAADLVRFLASPAASFVNGDVLRVP